MIGGMRVTFLGTGTSHGIPMIGCDCAVCRSEDPHDKRLRPSIFVEEQGTRVLVDPTPDFRTQALRAGIRWVDATLLTHTHADHILGMDDLRVFTGKNGRKMPVYGSTQSLADIQRMFPYACTEKPRWEGLPSFSLEPIEPNQEFVVGSLRVRPVVLPHGWMNVYGFVFGRELAYLTDCNAVPADVVQLVRGVSVLVLEGLRHRPHPTHLTVAQALEVAGAVGAKLTLLTHVCHELMHQPADKELPAGVRLAYDGMQIEVNNAEWRQTA